MIDDPSLWREVERVVSHHQKISDPTPFDALNRLFREYFRGRKDVPNLGKDNCRVRMEKLGWKELDRIVRKDKKTRNLPKEVLSHLVGQHADHPGEDREGEPENGLSLLRSIKLRLPHLLG